MNDVFYRHRDSRSETVAKRDVIIVLPYFGFQSKVLKRPVINFMVSSILPDETLFTTILQKAKNGF